MSPEEREKRLDHREMALGAASKTEIAPRSRLKAATFVPYAAPRFQLNAWVMPSVVRNKRLGDGGPEPRQLEPPASWLNRIEALGAAA
jgi:hypothetical protein